MLSLFTFRITPSVVLALSLAMPFTYASGQDADAVLNRLKSTYDSIESIRATFTQTMSSAFMAESQQTSGTVILVGDKYRIETGAQTIVTDGIVTWVYSSADDQLIINDYEEDETSFSINDFFFHFDDRYEVVDLKTENIDGRSHHRLSLAPKDPASFFKEVTMWVRNSDSVITTLRVLDANDTEMLFTLDDIQIDLTIAPDTFNFIPDEGTDVLDLRS